MERQAMPPELIALIDNPILLLSVLFVGALIGIAFEQFDRKQRQAAWRRRNPGWDRGEVKAGARRDC